MRAGPFIAAGGPCAFQSEPLADIIDFFMVGDGEEVLVEVCEAHKPLEGLRAGQRCISGNSLTGIKGVYVPKFYTPVYNEDGTIKKNHQE